MRKLIGITGNANAGKDTLADYIINNKNNSFIKDALAKPIKDIMINQLGFTY
jgi:dephospho-CoA kinase